MPARNKRAAKEERLKKPVDAANITVGETPNVTAPAAIVKKTFQEALVDGYERPSSFMKDFLDVDLYPAQAEVADALKDAVEGNFSAGNRVGKTFLSGGLLVWKAFYRHHPSFTDIENRTQYNTYKAVNCSLTFDQSKLAWTYAYNFMTSSKRFSRFLVDTVHSPFPKMTLRTPSVKGDWEMSEIHARSLAKNGLYLLGMSINHLQVDERAYIPKYEHIRDEVLRMRLADTGGSIFQISTPNGRNGFYTDYQLGRKGDPRYISRTLTTWDNPFVSRTYLEQLRETMLPEFYAQNVLGEFISLSDFFKIDVIEALYVDADYSLPVEPAKGAEYVMGVDLGAARDPSVVYVWRVDVSPAQMVYAGESRNPNWRAQRAFVMQTWHTYKPAKTYVDATGVGAPPYQTMVEEDGLENAVGHVITHANKPDTLTRLQDAAQRKKFIFPYVQQTKELVSQLGFYRLDDKDIAQDHVIALAMVNLAYEEWAKRNEMTTTIYEDLAFVDVLRGGAGIGGTDLGEGPGTLFDYDPRSGLFLPSGGEYFEGDNDGFLF